MVNKSYLLVFSIIVFIVGCTLESPYERMVKQEQAKNITNDSLFLGYTFGMSKQEFYDHSRELNQERRVYQGQQAASMRYEVEDLKHSAHMNYFAEFYDGKLYKIPARYMYNGWAPWNKELWSDSLKIDLLRSMKDQYDTDFVEMKHPELGVLAYIAVIGNQRISIFEAGDKEVAVNYVDLTNLPETAN